MSNFDNAFDPVGMVVNWIDACRQRRLSALVGLYDDAATLECPEAGSFRGKSELENYWRPRLAKPAPGAFAIDVLLPEAEGVSLDYRNYDGKPVRTHFRFNNSGKIVSTESRQT